MVDRRKDQRTKRPLKKRIEEHLKEVYAEEKGEAAIRLARAKRAEQEGFSEVAACLREIAYDEAKHAALIAELLYAEDIRDTKSNIRSTIEADRYAYDREREFLSVVQEAGDEEVLRLVEQLISDEKAHIEKLEELSKKLGRDG